MEHMDLRPAFELQRQARAKNPFPSARERRENLNRLRRVLIGRQEDLARSIHEDFGGRSRMEVLLSEVFVSVHALRHAAAHVEDWMRERPASLDWPLQPGRAYVMPQPAGVVGGISSWNYPVFVSIAPMAGALAAGNRVMLKPSEFTPRTSALLAAMMADTFSADHVTVCQGDAETGKAFASLPFDHLIFTGSTAVGKEIMRAAAENLTPLTLELGGKSPAIVAEGANLSRAAADIAYGKLLNAGQTCIAPDYALVPKASRARFVEAFREAAGKLYPGATSNPDYTSIIDDRQFSRLHGYVDEARAAGVETVELSEGRPKRFAPTLLLDPPEHLRVMREEIFGPILPVVSYAEIDDAISYVNARPKPLSLYLFASSERIVDRVLKETAAGGVCVNDTLVHIVAENLPFGGVGASGFGAYHGQAGFDACSRLKPVFRRQGTGLGVSLRPPYGRVHEWMRRILIR
jgi:aldehyde dehydrogenase (NAD+)/coniferyl-aldehyde dehydrogenase